MFSKHLYEYAETKYQERSSIYYNILEELNQRILEGTKEEQVLLKFIYGTTPARDATEYSFEIMKSYVVHSLWLRKNMEWCKALPEDIFLHNVLYHRINSEDIQDCRSFFYHKLKDRIKGLDLKSAVLEINYWCSENATYEAADSRTAAPMTVYRSGRGRCGEESTFTVTALRSVGIPARQVYTPRWAHCEDNHAWVEVYIEGVWYFIGACEPEEVLNKGWFSNAASRAMLVHSRNFSDFISDSTEACIGQEEGLVYYNSTATYAKTKVISIYVVNDKNMPIENAKVEIQLLNMAEFSSIATMYTDKEGKVSIEIGLGDIQLNVVKNNLQGQQLVSVMDNDEATVIVREKGLISSLKNMLEKNRKENIEDYLKELIEEKEFKAPLDYPLGSVILTREQRQTNKRRLKEAEEIRESRLKQYYIRELAEKYPGEIDIFKVSGENFMEIYQFLEEDRNSYRRAMLHTLTKKDYRDLKKEILEDHLQTVRGEYNHETYIDYVLCPRIYFEELTPYRSFLQQALSAEEKISFIKNPELIWRYIQNKIGSNTKFDYSTIYGTPIGVMKLGVANEMSKKILFVAICRTLGIPARLNRTTEEVEYYFHNVFVSLSAKIQNVKDSISSGILKLIGKKEDNWTYFHNYTIGKLVDLEFQTLNYEDIEFHENKLTLTLEVGIYRLITTCRMPNGNQHMQQRIIVINKGQEKQIQLTQKAAEITDLLVENPLPDVDLKNQDGKICGFDTIIKAPTGLLAFLDVGYEPTEHLLNEMYEQRGYMISVDISFVLREPTDLKNTTLAMVLKKLPNIQIYYDKEMTFLEPIARRMYVDPEKLPLFLVRKDKNIGIYACSGYNVGSVNLAKRILELQ